MKLFHVPGTCSQAPFIVLTELGLKCDIEIVDFANPAELMKVNPRCQVPTLVLDNGHVLTEGAVIMEYLCDQKPEMNIMPKLGTWERYRAQESMNYIATEFHKGIGAMFMKGMTNDTKTFMRTAVEQKLATLNTRLGKFPFLTGPLYCAADSYCFTVMNWTKWVGIDMKSFPNILAFCERVGSRPAVQKVVQLDTKKPA